jgi:hypothetical protein
MRSGRPRLLLLSTLLGLACAPVPGAAPEHPGPVAARPAPPLEAPPPAPSPMASSPAPVRGKQPEPEPAESPPSEASDAAPPPVRHPFHEPWSRHPANAAAFRFAKLSPRECRTELERRKLPVKRLGETRGIATPLRLTGALHGVRFVAPGGKSKFGWLDCRLALTLDELARVLARHGVVEIRVDSYYRPSARLPGRRIKSQHHYGLAMDVMSLRLDDGRTLDVERDWHGAPGTAACGPDAAPTEPTEATITLRNVVCEIVREGLFHHVLTPNYDAAHRDHLHLDIKREGWAVIVR